MKIQKFKNDGGFQEVYTEPSEVAEFVKINIESMLDYWTAKCERLERDNDLLRKNEYVQKIEEEKKELEDKLNHSFYFNKKMRKEADEWHNKHFAKEHSKDKKWQIHYEIHPTHIEEMMYVVCDICGEKHYLGGY